MTFKSGHIRFVSLAEALAIKVVADLKGDHYACARVHPELEHTLGWNLDKNRVIISEGEAEDAGWFMLWTNTLASAPVSRASAVRGDSGWNEITLGYLSGLKRPCDWTPVAFDYDSNMIGGWVSFKLPDAAL